MHYSTCGRGRRTSFRVEGGVNGYRFFEEFRDDAQRESAGNVIAVNIADGSFV